jgi:pyruvate formate lyase activating enzyme
VSASELASTIKKQESFLMSHGGVTISGGEPLAQPDFLLELMEHLKPLHLAVETSGYASQAVFQSMCGLADLVMIDIKMMDPEKHGQWTGVSNKQILENITWLKQQEKNFVVRIPLIPGVNDDSENLGATAEFLSGAKALKQVELLPYNTMAGSKYASVGRTYNPGFDESITPRTNCTPFQQRGLPCSIR